MTKTADEYLQQVIGMALERGWQLAPMTQMECVAQGLAENDGHCPCRARHDERDVCPCVWAEEMIKTTGHCHCRLFWRRGVTPEMEEDE